MFRLSSWDALKVEVNSNTSHLAPSTASTTSGHMSITQGLT